MGNVPTTNLNAYYATTTPGNTINSGVIDPALQDIVQAINDNFALFSNFINPVSGELLIPDQTIVTRHIRNNAITNPKYASLSITADKLADGSITLTKLAELVVTAAKIANFTITEGKMANGSVSRRMILPGVVGANEIDPTILNPISDATINVRLNQIDEQLADNVQYILKWVTDDGTDQTANFQTAFNACEGKVLFINNPAVEYIISSTIDIPSNIVITGMGKPRIKLANNSNCQMFSIRDKEHITISNLELDGNKDNQSARTEFHHAFKLENSVDVELSNNIMLNFPGDGVTLGHYGVTTGESNVNKNVKLLNNIVHGCGRNGFSLGHCVDVVLSGNTIYDQHAYVSTLGAGIDIEPNPGLGSEKWIVRNVRVSGNYIYDNNVGINVYGYGSVSTLVIEEVTISDNIIIKNVHATLPNASQDMNLEFLNEAFISTRNIRVSNNILGQTGQTGTEKGIFIQNCKSNIVISANTIKKVARPILLTGCEGIEISQNTISEFSTPSGGSAIGLTNSTKKCVVKYNIILNASFSSSSQFGISVVSATIDAVNSDNIIDGNIIQKTSTSFYMYVGIEFVSNNVAWTGVIVQNSLSNNTITGATQAAIRFTNCNASDNYIGVNVFDGIKKIIRSTVFLDYDYEADSVVTTAGRPTLNNLAGLRKFDSTLDKPIWRNAANTVWLVPSLYVAVPASATATGVVGNWSADASYVYFCHAANTWKRVAIATW